MISFLRPIRRFQLLLSLAVVVLLSPGCGDSTTPSLSQCRSLLEEHIKTQSQGRIKLVEFAKTDGQAQQYAGVNYYQMDYSGTIEFLEDVNWGEFILGGQWQGTFLTSVRDPSNKSFLNAVQTFGSKPMNKGHKEKITSKLRLERTEKGWRLIP